jgi:4-hydroxy-tetrahydrodipicolinate synthase
MTASFLTGLSAFPITPCNPSGQVDTDGLRRLIERMVDGKVDSIGLLGSTGSYMYLSAQERRRALDAGMSAANATPVVVGVGALTTREAVSYAQDAKAAGAAAGLLSAVSYISLTDDEVYTHFTTVARESQLPIVIYDNPGSTGFTFTPTLTYRLAQVQGIVGIKNPGFAREELERHLAAQRDSVPEGFAIGYSGDWFCAEALIAGADTWYSVLAGIFPAVCARITDAARRGDDVEARRLNAELEPLWRIFSEHGSLRSLYIIAELLDLFHAEPPRPLLPSSDSVQMELARIVPAIETLNLAF